MKKFLLNALLTCFLSITAQAQFNSGSTGADGALDLSTCPTSTCEVQLPESGVLNYTTVTVPANKSLKFKRNSTNTPVIMLAQGAVIVVGGIDINGTQLIPGPGGFYGGKGQLGGASGRPGFGSGGGIFGSDSTKHGKWIGPLSLFPIVGGSGGCGGIQCTFAGQTPDGGGGGGAIIIASSQTITIEGFNIGAINANGGGVECPFGGAGNGSGGAIRLIANSIVMSGTLTATGNNNGVIRLETNNLTFTGTSTPLATSAPINPSLISSTAPKLTIASIGGYTVPGYAGSRFDLIDLLLPNQLPDPINVVVSAVNIPVGTQVQVGFVSGSPNGTATPCNLAGSFAGSQCTATISNLNRTGGTYLLATAVFPPPASLAEFNPKGENQVVKIKLEAALGGKPKYLFLKSDESVIDPKRISPQFLQKFGM